MWTSGRQVDCDNNFAWCTTNELIEFHNSDLWKHELEFDIGTQCVAMTVEGSLELANCTSNKFILCEIK